MHELYIYGVDHRHVVIFLDGDFSEYVLQEPLSKKYVNKLITGKTTQHINRILRVVNKKINYKTQIFWIPSLVHVFKEGIKKEILKIKLSQI